MPRVWWAYTRDNCPGSNFHTSCPCHAPKSPVRIFGARALITASRPGERRHHDMDGELDRPAGVAARRQAGLTTSALAASLEDLQVTCQPPVLSHQPSLTSPQCLRREVDSEYEQRYRSLPFNQTVEVEAASSSFAFDDEELDGPVYAQSHFLPTRCPRERRWPV